MRAVFGGSDSMNPLEKYLTHPAPFVRKGTAVLLRVPRLCQRHRATGAQYKARPPILANSFPKSGTHLLYQITQGLPHCHNYGVFLSSMISSFQHRARTNRSTISVIHSFVPGEVIRAHLFYEPSFSAALEGQNVVHYFILRDPRDVVVSASRYLRTMNRWHRLHRYFREASHEEGILLQIRGFHDQRLGNRLLSIAERFAQYRGWLDDATTMPIRYEDLVSARRSETLCRMAEFYAQRASVRLDINATAHQMAAAMDGSKSHTFRKGESGQWKEAFTPACKSALKDIAGDLLCELGYEQGRDW